MSSELVSIIIPIYNQEKYLNKCLTSLKDQTYRNIEIILVNDGSVDGSSRICRSFAEKDKRFRLYEQSNQGVSAARNNGIKYASGERLCFVDPDDYVASTYVEILSDTLDRYNADISMVSYLRCGIEDDVSDFTVSDKTKLRSGRDAVMQHFYGDNFWYSVVWGKLFKKSAFENVRFPQSPIGEDFGIIFKLFFQSSTIAVNDSRQYAYVQSAGSLTRGVFSKKRLLILNIYRDRIDYFRDRDSELYFLSAWDYFNKLLRSYLLTDKYLDDSGEHKNILCQLENDIRNQYRILYELSEKTSLSLKFKVKVSIKSFIGRYMRGLYSRIFMDWSNMTI